MVACSHAHSDSRWMILVFRGLSSQHYPQKWPLLQRGRKDKGMTRCAPAEGAHRGGEVAAAGATAGTGGSGSGLLRLAPVRGRGTLLPTVCAPARLRTRSYKEDPAARWEPGAASGSAAAGTACKKFRLQWGKCVAWAQLELKQDPQPLHLTLMRTAKIHIVTFQRAAISSHHHAGKRDWHCFVCSLLCVGYQPPNEVT